VYSAPWRQLHHGAAARKALVVIPADGTVAANTPLVPLLARRAVLVRFPFATGYLDRSGSPQQVDWIAVDLEQLEKYGVAFRGDWKQLRNARRWLSTHRDSHRVQAINSGVVVLQRDGIEHPNLEAALDRQLDLPLPLDPRRRS
jgi:hypothetical protein